MPEKKSGRLSRRIFFCIPFLLFCYKTSAQELISENAYEPLSVEFIQYMGKESLGKYQAYLSGTLVLEGIKARNIHGLLELTGGNTIITIKEDTRAVITGLYEKGNALFLNVCFEPDPALYLIFAQNLDGGFSLYHQEGVVRYGGDLYRVDREAAATAALHISVSRKDETGVHRVAEGREAEPETAEPETTEPKTTEPKTTEPKITEPKITEPKITEPKITEPKQAAPGNIRPKNAAEPRYRIQVGAYKNPAIAQKARNRLETAGFTPRFEMYGDFCRVFISGINAGEKDEVVRRLASAGFSQIWIRDE